MVSPLRTSGAKRPDTRITDAPSQEPLRALHRRHHRHAADPSGTGSGRWLRSAHARPPAKPRRRPGPALALRRTATAAGQRQHDPGQLAGDARRHRRRARRRPRRRAAPARHRHPGLQRRGAVLPAPRPADPGAADRLHAAGRRAGQRCLGQPGRRPARPPGGPRARRTGLFQRCPAARRASQQAAQRRVRRLRRTAATAPRRACAGARGARLPPAAPGSEPRRAAALSRAARRAPARAARQRRGSAAAGMLWQRHRPVRRRGAAGAAARSPRPRRAARRGQPVRLRPGRVRRR